MSYRYDLFISHASEDKDFVRPLARALRSQRLAIWFDEFELKPGMRLRESIDQGLVSSRFGLVVLSPSFFAKAWPRWELDGLVQLAHSSPELKILPIWHNLSHSDVVAVSPSLANIVAIQSQGDYEHTTSEVLHVLRHRPTAVEVARDILSEHGFPVPLLSDDWWLDAAAWSAPVFGEGTFQEASCWGWWGFPLPFVGHTSEEKGSRIAWAAMQHSWQNAAVEERISQCTPPGEIMDFLQRQPGLKEAAKNNVDYLLSYAPQLGIAGQGGDLESLIDSIFRQAESSIRSEPTRGAPGWIFRASDLCNLGPVDVANSYFWPSDPAGTAPEACILAWVDAASWLASSSSNWLPANIKAYLIEGMVSIVVIGRLHRGRVDVWDVEESESWQNFCIHGPDAMSQREFIMKGENVLRDRVQVSTDLLSLPETAVQLSAVISSWGVLRDYWVYGSKRNHPT